MHPLKQAHGTHSQRHTRIRESVQVRARCGHTTECNGRGRFITRLGLFQPYIQKSGRGTATRLISRSSAIVSAIIAAHQLFWLLFKNDFFLSAVLGARSRLASQPERRGHQSWVPVRWARIPLQITTNCLRLGNLATSPGCFLSLTNRTEARRSPPYSNVHMDNHSQATDKMRHRG